MDKGKEKLLAATFLIEGNPYSPMSTSYILKNGDYETRLFYPSQLMCELKKIEDVKNGKEKDVVLIENRSLYDVVKKTYDINGGLNYEIFDKYYKEVKKHIESLKDSGLLRDDINDYFSDEGFEFTSEIINSCLIELFRLLDCEDNTSSVYCYNTDSNYVKKYLLGWLSEKGVKQFNFWHHFLYKNDINYTYFLLFVFLSISECIGKSKRSKVKTYIMKGENGLYKIGKSENPRRRERNLKCGNPKINLLFSLNCDIEKDLHKKFADKCVGGEWFRLTEKDLEYIKKYKKKNNN